MLRVLYKDANGDNGSGSTVDVHRVRDSAQKDGSPARRASRFWRRVAFDVRLAEPECNRMRAWSDAAFVEFAALKLRNHHA